MKKLFRALSLLLCTALIFAAVHMDALLPALAENMETNIVITESPQPEEMQPAASETPAAGETLAPTAEPASSQEPKAAPASSAEPEPQETAVPTQEPSEEPTAPDVTSTVEASATPDAQTSPEPEESASPEETPTAVPAATSTPEATELPSAEPSSQPTADPTAEPTPEVPQIDYSKNAAENPEFTSGFARIPASCNVFDLEGKLYAALYSGVVYAVSRSAEPDRLEIAFQPAGKGEIESCWIDAQNLYPLNPEGEIPEYLAACKDAEDVLLYRGDEAMPLRPVDCEYPQPDPVTARLNVDAAVIGVKDKGLRLQISFSDGGDYPVRFVSSRASVAKVNAETGVVTGVKRGSAVISAITEFGTLECAVTVKKAPTSIKIKPKSAELGIGEQAQLSVAFNDTKSGSTYRFESGDESIVTVNENGVITGVSKGRAVVYAYAYNLPKKPAKAEISVLGPATAISIPEESIYLAPGMEAKVTVQFPENERDVVSYTSDDESVVSVSEDGVIRALKLGSAFITAATSSGASDSCAVRVLAAPQEEDIILLEDQYRIGEKESFSLLDILQVSDDVYANLRFESSKPKIASVDGFGTVRGLKKGSALVRAVSHNGIERIVKVNVLSSADSVLLKDKYVVIGTGKSHETQIRFSPSGSYSQVRYFSSDESVAIVDEFGVITGVSEGLATITADPLKGKSATCRVNVMDAPESIGVEEAEIRVGLGEAGRYVAGSCPDNTLCSFSYASSDESVLRVNALTGEITTVSIGSAEVLVRSDNGLTATCRVHVLEEPSWLVLDEDEIAIIVGERYDGLSGTINEGAASDLTLKSQNTRYVKIEDGAIVGVREGKATVLARTYNGVIAKCRVTVKAAPKSVHFAEEELHIGSGESVKNAVSFKPGKLKVACSYETVDASIASVDPLTGEITGIKPGTTQVRVITPNGKTDVCTVKVYAAPETVHFAEKEYVLSEGMSLQAEVIYSAGAAGARSFEIGDDSIAVVDKNGCITALSAGSTQLKTTTYNGREASCTVKVVAAPAELLYSFADLTVRKGDIVPLPVPVAFGADGNECPVSYSFKSSASRVVEVNKDGEARALRKGTSVITAKSHNGLTAKFKLTVSESKADLQLSPMQATIYTDGAAYNENLQLSAALNGASGTKIYYLSSNPAIATVDENGLVTAVGPGEVRIMARTAKGVYAIAQLSVRRLSTSISFGMEEAELGEFESLQLQPVFDAGSSAIVQYASSDESVAKVDENGLVTANAPGTAQITARMQNGVETALTLQVLPGPDRLELNVERMYLAVGEEIILRPELSSKEEEFRRALHYASSNEAVISVDESGAVRAMGQGMADVIVTACNGISDRFTIKVVKDAADARLSFEEDHYSIVCKDIAHLTVVMNKAAYEHGFALLSSDPELLHADGLSVEAHEFRTGTVTLSLVSSAPGASFEDASSCTVEVVGSAGIELSREELRMKLNSTAELSYSITPADLIGTRGVRVTDESIARYDEASGMITSLGIEGETDVLFWTYSGVVSTHVTVTAGGSYRALIIGEYNGSGDSGDLPFIANNAATLRNTLRYSSVNGNRYTVTRATNNPSKGQIRSLIETTFADTAEDDVSLIYIVSHGHYKTTGNGYYGYFFSLAPDYSPSNPSSYVTAEELMSVISQIKGDVVLVIASCHSGGFIRDCRDELDAAGNISVITAQSYDKYASFYVGKTEATTAEFFTFSLCKGLGVEQRNNYLSAMPADKNGDGSVTVSEAFSYARSNTISLVKSHLNSYDPEGKHGLVIPNGYYNGWNQSPQVYIAKGAENLVIYARETAEQQKQ